MLSSVRNRLAPSVVAVLAAVLLCCRATTAVSYTPADQQPTRFMHIDLNGAAAGGADAYADNAVPYRGVCLGGWFVLEPWIVPSLFNPHINGTFNNHSVWDEYSLVNYIGMKDATPMMLEHWDTWITEADIAEVAQAGITDVRLPVGYWMLNPLPNETWVPGETYFFDRFLGWARKYNIRVLLDLHGAPGSQNGQDHSGHRGPLDWDTDLTVQTLKMFILYIRDHGFTDVIHAIELVNEPWWSVDPKIVQDFYVNAYSAIRQSSPSFTNTLNIVFHDNFNMNAWGGIMEPPAYTNLFQDSHQYHCFDNSLLAMDYAGHLNYTCNNTRPAIVTANKYHPTFMGEWSLATTDCPQWANGFLNGNRWEGTLSPGDPVFGKCTGNFGTDVTQFTPDYRAFLRQFTEMQMDAYEAASGWYFWTLKTESAPQWDFLMGLREGWIPNPVTKREYHC
ncbi:glucan 1,3-beta-glucosidase [Capsaspora owczarzaki ATCC 30864]|uniref:glucan 1,3-beta-glucosidase n=1 Tax=Capsaspora owczarzaki (strain ATCC 30864) TaxID=595528 RepID=A0A0D2X4F6_CAPO3|nr:glucan 1,3-beta-glucosidase [Capsaspora owczarzaki ATCC 30864]KJE95974.1 glucan 1,3-beta-glucosidase [Capsaspora owczarzaki ATCC 30864]|eukprot:XP_004345101.2 glucan 1,3-beta-glucosidase [Capsaspora owczarzaki ATCC 30864]